MKGVARGFSKFAQWILLIWYFSSHITSFYFKLLMVLCWHINLLQFFTSYVTIRSAACYSQADHHMRSQVLKASAIVNNNAKYNSFVLAEGTLSKSSARVKFSEVAQHRENAGGAALSYVNAAEKSMRASRRGISVRGLPHKYDELHEQKHN